MAEISSLEIKLEVTGAEKTAQDIEMVKKSLSKLATTFSNVSKKLNNVNYEGVVKMTKALKDMASIDLKDLAGVGNTFKALQNTNVEELAKKVKDTNKTMDDAVSGKSNVSSGDSVIDRFKQMKNAIKGIGAESSKSEGKVKSFGSTLMKSVFRIAMYRAIRSVLKTITDAFKTGINNAYQWSKAIGGDFAKAMDKVSSSTNYLKNSLGAAFTNLLVALEPIITKMIDWFVEVVNWINKIVSALSGSKTWTQAIKTQKEYAAAVKASTKALAGFDEINNIATSNATSNNDSYDFKEMANELAENSFLTNLKMTIDNVLFDWNNWNLESISEKIIAGLGAIIGIASGGFVGGLIGLSLGLVLDSIIFNNDGKISYKEVKDSLFALLTSLAWAGIGFSLGGVSGAAIGMTISVSLSLAFDSLGIASSDYSYATTRRKLQLECEALGISSREAMRLGLKGTPEDDQIIIDNFGAWGEDIVKGVKEGVDAEKARQTSWWTSFCNWFGNLFKKENEINSPSKLFYRYGGYIVEGLANGVDANRPTLLSKFTTMMNELKTKTSSGMTSIKNEFTTKWNSLKSWWTSLELPSFKIKTPHLSWYYEEASSWYAKILSALGLPTQIPKLAVSWYDVGTNYVSEDQLAMVHKGEAIVPAKYNTDPAYRPYGSDETLYEVANMIVEAINNKDMNAYISPKEVGKASVEYINNQSRLIGRSLI